MKTIVVIGATSALAQAIIKIHAAENDRLILVGRNRERLELICNDSMIQGAGPSLVYDLDLTEVEEHDRLWEFVYENTAKPDVVYIAHGILPDQKGCEKSYTDTFASLQVNALSVMSLLTNLSNRMEQDRHGKIVVISSVAGDRGRKSNYIYGTAKAAVSTFLQGLRNRLYASNVSVITVKQGFIETPMTVDFKKGLLWATTDKVALDIVKAVNKNKNVIYTPFFWLYIMLVIKSIPESIFKRLSL